MRPLHYVPRPAFSQLGVVELLQRQLPLRNSPSVSARLLAQVLLWICLWRSTQHAAAERMGLSVSDETLRKALQAHLPDMPQLLGLLAAGLEPWRTRVKPERRKRGYVVAIDVHHQPYYGQLRPGVFRGKASKGTKRFWSVATAALLEKGQRLSIAFVPVQSNRMQEVLEALWPQIEVLGIPVRRLLLDRGFYGAPVIAWLQARQIPFVLPMIRRGTRRRGAPATGTLPFFVRGRRGFSTHVWRERNRGRWMEVNVAVVPHRDHRRRPLVYAYGGRLPNLAFCQTLYKRRFGIETIYRLKNECCGWTTSRNPRWRRLLQLLPFVIHNAWVISLLNFQITTRRAQIPFALFQDALRQLIAQETSEPQATPPFPGPS